MRYGGLFYLHVLFIVVPDDDVILRLHHFIPNTPFAFVFDQSYLYEDYSIAFYKCIYQTK